MKQIKTQQVGINKTDKDNLICMNYNNKYNWIELSQ